MNIVQTSIENHGVMFDIERLGAQAGKVKGLPNHEKATNKQYIGILPDSKILKNDWLIYPDGTRIFIKDVSPSYAFGELQQYKAFYLTEAEYKKESDDNSTTIFNIGSATGSVIGTQSVVNFNYSNTIQQLKEQLSATDSDDKQDLEKIASILEMIVNNELPPQKGMFSKFAAVLKRNDWFATPIMSALFGWLTSQIP